MHLTFHFIEHDYLCWWSIRPLLKASCESTLLPQISMTESPAHCKSFHTVRGDAHGSRFSALRDKSLYRRSAYCWQISYFRLAKKYWYSRQEDTLLDLILFQLMALPTLRNIYAIISARRWNASMRVIRHYKSSRRWWLFILMQAIAYDCTNAQMMAESRFCCRQRSIYWVGRRRRKMRLWFGHYRRSISMIGKKPTNYRSWRELTGKNSLLRAWVCLIPASPFHEPISHRVPARAVLTGQQRWEATREIS